MGAHVFLLEAKPAPLQVCTACLDCFRAAWVPGPAAPGSSPCSHPLQKATSWPKLSPMPVWACPHTCPNQGSAQCWPTTWLPMEPATLDSPFLPLNSATSLNTCMHVRSIHENWIFLAEQNFHISSVHSVVGNLRDVSK